MLAELAIPAVPIAPPTTAAQIFTEHGSFVFRTVRRLGVRPSDVEDATQEVFLVVHRRLDQFDPRYSIKSWLFGIASRVASDYRRKAHVRREQVSDEPAAAPVHPVQVETVERNQTRILLDRALDSLDEKRREVFVLYELEGMSMPEISAAVGCPLQTAYSRLHTARDRMRSELLRLSQGGSRER